MNPIRNHSTKGTSAAAGRPVDNGVKIALVHDWFIGGLTGGDRVLVELARLYPEAPIYTLLASRHSRLPFAKSRLRTSFLDRLPEALKQHRKWLLPLIPRAVASFDLRGFDVVISNSGAFAKNVTIPYGTKHICYCNSPMRFAWDYRGQYLKEQGFGPLKSWLAERAVQRMRRWDLGHVDSIDLWLANSKTVAQRIQRYYHRRSQVVYPPVATSSITPSQAKKDFYITVSTLTPYKKIDLAIAACNQAQRLLYVVGDGPDRKRLEQLAGPTIRFMGRVNDTRKHQLLAQARGLLFPSKEDFGMTPVEAMAAATPVVAYNQGGITETVTANKTGVFFKVQTVAALNTAIGQLEKRHFKTADMVNQAKLFSPASFRKQVTAAVKKLRSA